MFSVHSPVAWRSASAARRAQLRPVWLMLALVLASAPCSRAFADREACISAHEDAQLMRLRGQFTAAREDLLKCAQSGCPQLISNDCTTWLAEVEASLPSVVFAVSDSTGMDLVDVQVWANDKLVTDKIDGRALVLDPGAYKLRFQARGYAPVEQPVTLHEGQKQRLIRTTLVAQPTDSGEAPAEATASSHVVARADQEPALIPLSTWLLGGGALAALGGGIALGLMGDHQLKRLERECGEQGCSSDEIASGKRLYVAADVAFGVSVVLAATATWLFFARDRPSKAADTGFRAGVHASGGMLVWRARY